MQSPTIVTKCKPSNSPEELVPECAKLNAVQLVTPEPFHRPLLRRMIGAGVRVVRAAMWSRRLAKFGHKSDLAFPAYIVGGTGISIGNHVEIWHHARIEALQPTRVNVRIGSGTIIQPYVHIGAVDSVTIGKRVLIASRVYITDHDHDIANPSVDFTTNARVLVAPVEIGDGVWLGEGVIVLKGVTIGDHSVIGAGSIVTKSVPPYSVAVGAPARVIRQFDLASGHWMPVGKA